MSFRSVNVSCRSQPQQSNVVSVIQGLPRRLALIGASIVPALAGQRIAAASGGSENSKGVRSVVSAPQAALLEEPSAAIEALETDKNGQYRLPYRPQGWDYWTYEGHRIHYVRAGTQGPPVVLVHGFGASAYHWRYNVPALAANHRVFAVDLLGFGWSDKPLISGYADYSVWQDQLASFIQEVVGGEPVVLVGNSLGGYNSLATAVKYPQLVKGVVLLNGAGRFEEVKAAIEQVAEAALGDDQEGKKQVLRQAASSNGAEESSILSTVMKPVKEVMMRGTVYFSFMLAKQPSRIEQVLRNVYPDDQNIDNDLVASIVAPAQHPNAAEVFYRIITGSGQSLNSLLERLDTPLFLLWGEADPWIGPRSAQRIRSLYPKAELVLVPAGHCPHDEAPQQVNQELIRWISSL
eukprot:jgi/Botrbrau1/4901/Bobra.118_1s0015.1